MELIGVERSRLIELFVATRPEGQPSAPRWIQLLVERYEFVGFPTTIEDLGGESINFKRGVFRDVAIDTFDIHRDGVVVASKAPSDLLDAFVDDVCLWMEKAIGLKRIETHTENNKNYESHVVIRTSAPVLRALDAFTAISDIVTKSLAKTTRLEAAFHPASFALAADDSLVPGMKPIAFRLERKGGVPFDSNFYYSAAPLPTSEHIKVLERIEKLF